MTRLLRNHTLLLITLVLSVISIFCFIFFLNNELGLAYNDARSHLNIGRRVVEGLKPGLAQLGSVWLPLPHLLMVPTIWHDYFWQSGLSGAIQSMVSFVATGILIYKILEKLKVALLGRIVGVFVFAINLNILYLQSTAMTELLLLFTMTAGVYEFIKYHQDNTVFSLIKSSFWIMLSTLIRYDGWFLLFFTTVLVVYHNWKSGGFKKAEGMFFLFCTMGGLGIVLWFLWNLVIFNDPLYFAFGPYSAHAQQLQIEEAGELLTKYNLPLSIATYSYAMIFNTGWAQVILGALGAILFWFDEKQQAAVRLASIALLAPLIFNILALYLGHSVLFLPNIHGESWFNIRYGVMMIPSIAVFIGYLVHRANQHQRIGIISILLIASIYALIYQETVTIADGKFGSSQKNVTEVSEWLAENVRDTKGFVLISAASHDAIIFASDMPMKRFIHEGSGEYWENATQYPDRWAHWIIMRTNDNTDQTFKLVNESGALDKYTLVESFPFADMYQLKPEYRSQVELNPNIGK